MKTPWDKFLKRYKGTTNYRLIEECIKRAIRIDNIASVYGNAVVRELNKTYFAKIISDIEKALTLFGEKEITITEFNKKTEAIYSKYESRLQAAYSNYRKKLVTVCKSEFAWGQQTLFNVLPSTLRQAVDISKPTLRVIDKAIDSNPFQGRLIKDWFTDLSVATKRSVANKVKIGLVNNKTPIQIGKTIKDALNLPRYQANTLSRTLTRHVQTSARSDFIEENDDIIGEWQFIAVLDAGTTDICLSLHGRTFKVGEGPYPPLHYNCRSEPVPVVKSTIAKKLGITLPKDEYAMLGGPVDLEDFDKNQWVKNMSVAEQNKLLSVKYADKFRRNEIDLDDFFKMRRLPQIDQAGVGRFDRIKKVSL